MGKTIIPTETLHDFFIADIYYHTDCALYKQYFFTRVSLLTYLQLFVFYVSWSSPSDDKRAVCNSSSANKTTTNNGQTLLHRALKYFVSHPFDEIMCRPSFFRYVCRVHIFYIVVVFQQVLPSTLVDYVLKTIGYPQSAWVINQFYTFITSLSRIDSPDYYCLCLMCIMAGPVNLMH